MDGGAWWAAVHGVVKSRRTERLDFHFSLSCIGEGNGNPLQCSCLENPRDGGAWWAAVYGVAQSRTRLKWLSSSRHSFQNTWSMKDTAIKHCIISLVHSGNSHDIYFRDNLLTWTKILLVSQDSVHYPCFAVSTKTKL